MLALVRRVGKVFLTNVQTPGPVVVEWSDLCLAV
jgi:hypothetical protein